MPDKTIKLEEAAAWIDGELKPDMKAAAVRGLVSAAAALVQEITLRIIPTKSPQPVDRGVFRAGWRSYPEADGATIENTEPHAAFIEWGVRGGSVKVGFPLVNALTEWVQRKGIASGTDARSAAYGIALAAQRRGFFNGGTGFRILEDAMKLAPDIIRREVENELRRV